MAILVTGAGLLGSQVAAKLLEKGERVVLYDIAYDLNSVESIVDMNRVKAVVGDLLDLPLLIDTLKREKIDKIIHTASLLAVGTSTKPYTGVKVNIEGTLNILEAAKIIGIKRVVFTSSNNVDSAVRALGKAPHEEDFLMKCISQRPASVYGVTKLTAEYLGLSYNLAYGIDFVALRLGGLFGPWGKSPTGTPSKVVDQFVRNAAFGKPVIINDPFFTFSGIVDFVYSKDVAKACVLACFADELKSKIYNITWGKPYTFQDVIEATKEAFPGIEIQVKEVAKCGWGNTPANWYPYDISRAKKEFGYEPDFDLKGAFKDYGEWLRRYNRLFNAEIKGG